MQQMIDRENSCQRHKLAVIRSVIRKGEEKTYLLILVSEISFNSVSTKDHTHSQVNRQTNPRSNPLE